MSEQLKRDLVLPLGTYAHMLDTTKGIIKTYAGPAVVNPGTSEAPVVYDVKTGMYERVTVLEKALQISPVAVEGSYVILRNPAKGNQHPGDGAAPQTAPDLEIGRTVVIPGPATFALWPGQSVEVIPGHLLRSNQYLLVQVRNEEQARQNWSQAVMKPATTDDAAGTEAPSKPAKAPKAPVDLTIGKQMIICGTDVAFYIPPTGVEVVVDEDGQYVRDALTLERLEYATLVDENGSKRTEIGPQVVFPRPSERFVEIANSSGVPCRKFRAVELNAITGLHIKVIADYEEVDAYGKKVSRKAGEELFLTGKDTAIYFPREEHSAVLYDGRTSNTHFAVAIPAGEGRYVMNRLTGAIRTVKGPAMLLPDPRVEVIVRRGLSDRDCDQWYPGNIEAKAYNQSIRPLLQATPGGRQGAVSEDAYTSSRNGGESRTSGGLMKGATSRGGFENAPSYGLVSSVSASVGAAHMQASYVDRGQTVVGDAFPRASQHTDPRSITLDDTKFKGVPQIAPWTNYAVLVTSKTGGRRVEVGPATILLEYDERLESLMLSTGKPKTTDRLLETPYLCVANNQITDIFDVETQDHVKVNLKLAYRVNFEGDPLKWFNVANYVKLLCDHVRSVMRGRAQKYTVEAFYATSTDLIRDVILGKSTPVDGAKPELGSKRPGMVFTENGMRVVDVEVLTVVLQDEKIRVLLDAAQHDVVRSNVELSSLNRRLDVTRQTELIARETANVKAETKHTEHVLTQQLAADELATSLVRLDAAFKERAQQQKVAEANQAMQQAEHAHTLSLKQQTDDQAFADFVRTQEKEIELLRAEAEATVLRFGAVSGNFTEALLSLSHNETLVKVAQAWEVQKAVGGESLADLLQRVFHGTPFAKVVDKLALLPAPSNGTHTTARRTDA